MSASLKRFISSPVVISRLHAGVSGGSRFKYTLPDLPYDYNALEPVISADIMQVHHGKHHATYVANLNNFEDQFKEAMAKNDLKKAMALSGALHFNAGGHFNHALFWENLSPNGGGEPTGPLADAIKRDFGSFEKFKARLSAACIGVQGSGWGWLAYNPNDKRLEIATTPNQVMIEHSHGWKPLLTIDVWEHAYYLQYKNVRPEFVANVWKIINWKDIQSRFEKSNK